MSRGKTEPENREQQAQPMPPIDFETLVAQLRQEILRELSGQFNQFGAAAAQMVVPVAPVRKSLLDTGGEDGAHTYEVRLEHAPTARVKANNEGEAWMKYKAKVGLTASQYTPEVAIVGG